MTSDKKWIDWPHEGWCDIKNDLGNWCNCMASSYIESLDEANARAEKLVLALSKIANLDQQGSILFARAVARNSLAEYRGESKEGKT